MAQGLPRAFTKSNKPPISQKWPPLPKIFRQGSAIAPQANILVSKSSSRNARVEVLSIHVLKFAVQRIRDLIYTYIFEEIIDPARGRANLLVLSTSTLS